MTEGEYMMEGEWIVGGDFNEILNPQDRLGCNRIDLNIRRFREWLAKFGLVNVTLSNLHIL